MILEVKEVRKDAVGERPHIAETAGHEIEEKKTDEASVSEPSLTETGMYAQIVSQLREQALTTQELADVIGVNSRQVSNWASGHNVPRGERRERLLEIDYIVKQLRGIYTREGTEIWLHGRKRSLGHQRPIDLMREGRFQTVLNAIERLNAGAM
jgi:DNA-binding transcriptional regulator YiaG